MTAPAAAAAAAAAAVAAAVTAASEEADLDKIAEDELLRLQRQYRIMEMERATMCSTAKPKFRKQKHLTESLKKEYDQLNLDLKVSRSVSNLKKDIYIGNEMSELLLEKELLQKDISEEKYQIKEMDFLLRQVEKEMFALRVQQTSEKEELENVAHSQQRVAQLENRLEVVTKKFNTVNANNFKMRQEIDHLLQERSQFNIVWGNSLETLANGKSLMMELVEQSTLLYDQREEWCHKLQNIRERAQYDQVEHTHEMGELQRKLDHDSKLQQFLAVKGSVRVLAELEAKEAAKRRAQRDREIAIQERHRDILKQIQEFSEETDLERLTAKFTKQDEENYALFNYVNEVNHELESLANNVAELRVNIEDMRAQKKERDAREQESIEILKEHLRKQKEKTEAAEKKKTEAQTYLNKSLNGIQNLYTKMECSATPILQLLGTSDINIYNVMLYLKTIEKKTMDVVDCALYAENVKKIVEEVKNIKGKSVATILPTTKVKISTRESKKSKQRGIDKSAKS